MPDESPACRRGAARRRSTRPRRLALVPLCLAVPLVAACGSGGGGGGAAQATAPAALCQQILGVLSDGPDPAADPVGYALSQIKQLSEIRSSDTSVIDTLHTLVAADRALVSSNGVDHAASRTIARSHRALNVVCPGVAP